MRRFADHRIAVPLALWAVWALAFLLTGKLTWPAFGVWHALPREALAAEFWWSLLLLHTQPPAMNIVLGAVVKLSAATGLAETMLATGVTLAIQAAIALAWYRLAYAVSESRVIATAIVALPLTTPFLYFGSQAVSYTAIVPLCMALALGSACRLDGSARRFAMLGAALAMLVYTRALWHPLFGFGLFALAAILFLARLAERRRFVAPVLIGAAALVLPVGGWMAKNQILFGSMQFSSFLGINLGGTRTTDFFIDGTVDEALANDYYTPWQLSILKAHPATTIVVKDAPGAPPEARKFIANANHYIVPVLSRVDARERIAHYRAHPDEYVDRVLGHMRFFCLPLLSNPYSLDRTTGFHTLFKPGDELYRWVRIHDMLYHGDWLGRVLSFRHHGTRWRIPLFALLFVYALVASAVRLRWVRGREGVFLCLALATMGWFLAMVILVDGAEGARMRWEVEQVWLLLLMLSVRATARAISARRRLREARP